MMKSTASLSRLPLAITALAVGFVASNAHAATVAAGMDSNAGNDSVALAASNFSFSVDNFFGGSTLLTLDALPIGPLSGTSIALGSGVTLDATGNSDVSLQAGALGTFNSTVLYSDTGSGDLTFSFSGGTTHFGFYSEDFNTVSSGFDLVFDEGDGIEILSVTDALGGNGGLGFYGVIFSSPIYTLTLSGADGTGDVYEIDNILVSPVPEPSTYAALFGILAFCAVMVRRRKLV